MILSFRRRRSVTFRITFITDLSERTEVYHAFSPLPTPAEIARHPRHWTEANSPLDRCPLSIDRTRCTFRSARLRADTRRIRRIIMGFFAWIVVGLIAGWLAGQVMKGGGYGIFVDIILGILGG